MPLPLFVIWAMRARPCSAANKVAAFHYVSARGLGAFVKIDYGVIRGLAYYTGVVFEAFDKKGEFRAIAGGGRYDNLVNQLGGSPSPAVPSIW